MNELTLIARQRQAILALQLIRAGPGRRSACSISPSSSRLTEASALSGGQSQGIHTSSSHHLHHTEPTFVSAVRKASGREKARARYLKQTERQEKRRQKDLMTHVKANLDPTSTDDARFQGPKGEKLTLSQQERVLRLELNALSTQLEQMEKRAVSEEAEKELAPYDDETLDQLYQALVLPPPTTEEDRRLMRLEGERKFKYQRALNQRLLDARDRGRMLLPPSKALKSPAKATQRKEVKEEEADDGTVDLSKLSREEAQEVRLQLLFERLTIVPDQAAEEGKQQSLGDIKSSLAARIAKILENHDYVVKSPPPEQTSAEEPETKEEVATEPSFESLSFDRTTAKQEVSEASTSSQYLDAANEILHDVNSSTARNLMLERMESMLASSPKPASDQPMLPLGVATNEEWEALAVACARSSDEQGLARVFRLMKDSGHFPPRLSLLNSVLDIYASQANLEKSLEAFSLIARSGQEPNLRSYHGLTKAYLNDGQYEQAIKVINSLEDGEVPASMATYTLVIDRLIDNSKPEIQALGWNLFYHMRLVSHTVPDAPLYALMIRACAKGSMQPQDVVNPVVGQSGVPTRRPADTERALDLFREMTTRYGVRPNAEVYNALILACSRRKDFYLESFRLLREMVELETNRVASKADDLRFAPDRYAFNALLQGCARNKDLPRARWVLAEMIRSTEVLFDPSVQLNRDDRIELNARRPNDETLGLVFWSYASYTPPVKRGKMRKASEEATPATATTTEVAEQTKETSVEPLTSDEAAQVFTHLVPQTSTDLISEARALMARIIADQPREGKEGPLGSVTPSPRLLNAYLSVLARHLPPAQRLPAISDAVFTSTGLFRKLGIAPTGQTYQLLLDSAAKDSNRTAADELVTQAWPHFRALQNPSPRAMEKCWAYYIRNLAKSNQLEEALKALREFTELYPPAKTVPSLPVTEKTKQTLDVDLGPMPVAPQSILALGAVDVDRELGPVLTFEDLDLLHHRLVRHGHKDGLALVGWVARAYENAGR